MTTYENNALSEFTVYVDEDTSKAWDHAAYMLSTNTYGRKLRFLQNTAMVLAGVIFIEGWIYCLLATGT